MILSMDEPLVIGQHYRDGQVTDADGIWHTIPILVLREVTREDWIAYCHEQGATIVNPAQPRYFYEVSTD